MARVGLVALVRASGLEVIGEAGSAGDAAGMVHSLQPDVVLLDGDGNGGGPAAAIRLVADAASDRGAVVLLADDDVDVLAVLRAGAVGCILRDTSRQGILSAIARAREGSWVISPPLARRLVSAAQHATAPPRGSWPTASTRLTRREAEVLRLLSRGWDNRRIAAALYVSRATVKHHVSSIFAKLGVDNRIQAAVRAVQDGLLDP